MLQYRLLKNHAGILLIGDYHTLHVLRDVVLDVNERSPIVSDVEGPFIGLAYDARKAYERQRQIIKPPEQFEEIGIRYGVEILWPVLLVQHRILRASLSFLPNSARHQAIAYALEAVIEDAIAEDFGAVATEIKEKWQRIDPAQPWAVDKIYSRSAIFCSWSKHQRRKMFSILLDSLDPMFPSLHELRVKNGETELLSPDELDAWSHLEWPDPRW